MALRGKCNGAKLDTEALDVRNHVVGERSVGGEAVTVRHGGAYRSENAGISSEKTSENLVRRKPKGSWGRIVRPG